MKIWRLKLHEMGYFCPTQGYIGFKNEYLTNFQQLCCSKLYRIYSIQSRQRKFGKQVEGGWEFVEPKLPQHFIQLTIQILQRLNLGAKTQFTTCLKHSISQANITIQSSPCDCASARNCDAQRIQAPLSAQPHTNWPPNKCLFNFTR